MHVLYYVYNFLAAATPGERRERPVWELALQVITVLQSRQRARTGRATGNAGAAARSDRARCQSTAVSLVPSPCSFVLGEEDHFLACGAPGPAGGPE
jgi:hypothetical protein